MISMSMPDIINHLTQNLNDTDITLYPRATELEISIFESANNITLPDDVKQFYRFANGFESEEDQFRIVPLVELMHENNMEQKLYIAEYMVYCDMWELEINPDNPNDYNIRYSDVLTKSFAEFLRDFLIGGVFNAGGLYWWKDEIAKRGLL